MLLLLHRALCPASAMVRKTFANAARVLARLALQGDLRHCTLKTDTLKSHNVEVCAGDALRLLLSNFAQDVKQAGPDVLHGKVNDKLRAHETAPSRAQQDGAHNGGARCVDASLTLPVLPRLYA